MYARWSYTLVAAVVAAAILVGCSSGPNPAPGSTGGTPGSTGSTPDTAHTPDTTTAPPDATPSDPTNPEMDAYLAGITAPAAPTAGVVEGEAAAVAGWFRELEEWTDQVLLAPTATNTPGSVPTIDAATRASLRQALVRYYTPEQADGLLNGFWLKSADGYELAAREGHGVLPLMQRLEVVSAGAELVTIRGLSDPPALYERVETSYHLRWADAQFRVSARDLVL